MFDTMRLVGVATWNPDAKSRNDEYWWNIYEATLPLLSLPHDLRCQDGN